MRFSCHVFVLLGLWSAAGGLAAEVYRCTGSDGETMFSQSPCGAHSAPVVIRPRAPDAATSGLRAGELDWLERRQRERTQAAKRRVKASSRVVDGKAERRDCERRRMALEDVNARLRRGYRPAQGERLKQRRRMLEHYIDTSCRR